jgi:Arc/MetJ-type ribon-helix-helix transcriptional regulator
MRTFHLPLPETLHDALKEEAASAQRAATEVVREALTQWLDNRRRQRIADEIEAYARACAGTAEDLDSELERASLDAWSNLEPS